MRHGPASGRFEPVRPADHRPEMSDAKRVCLRSECTTVLSRYNHSEVCALHEPRL
jgi:hypothetical protein